MLIKSLVATPSPHLAPFLPNKNDSVPSLNGKYGSFHKILPALGESALQNKNLVQAADTLSSSPT